MIVKAIAFKGFKTSGGALVAALVAAALALIALLLVFSRYSNEITGDLAKQQVINLNTWLSADEVCIFDVGVLGSLEIGRKYPQYIRASGSDLMQEPMAYWSVIALHHKTKKYDVYLVDRGDVHLVEAPACSSSLLLRIERSRPGSDFWYAFGQREAQPGEVH
jgi:hypothetical protein